MGVRKKCRLMSATTTGRTQPLVFLFFQGFISSHLFFRTRLMRFSFSSSLPRLAHPSSDINLLFSFPSPLSLSLFFLAARRRFVCDIIFPISYSITLNNFLLLSTTTTQVKKSPEEKTAAVISTRSVVQPDNTYALIFLANNKIESGISCS